MRRVSCRKVLAAVILASFAVPHGSLADEKGISFWIPGFMGSLAATPQQPGWSLATIYYHTSVKAGSDLAFAYQVARGRITTNFTGNLGANLNADADLGFAIPTYVFSTPVLGGQAAVALIVPGGRNQVSVDATLTGAVGPIGFTRSAGRTDTVTGFADIIPQASLRWNFGVHNVMTYLTGNIPVGAYDAQRLANLGFGHAAIDWGAGYTYFNPQSGREFSAVGGFTYNFENTTTNYQSGVDFHLDMAASQFLSPQIHVGAVAYAYQQLTNDSGANALLGGFKSRVFGVGPQIGYIFPVGDKQGYLNLKGFKEFGAENRPEGWNVWLTFAISPKPPTAASPQIARLTK